MSPCIICWAEGIADCRCVLLEPSSVYQEDSGYDPLVDLARVVAQLTERVEAAEREIARLRALHPPTVADVEVSRG